MAINATQNKESFYTIVKENIHRIGMAGLTEWVEHTDFFTAPASTHFHGAEEGGLCQHSLNVYNQLKKVAALYAPGKFSDETLAIVSLFHDLCKCNTYKTEMRNAKDTSGQWVKVPFYKFDEDYSYGNHGGKSVFLIMQWMQLSSDEAAAIQSHMGFSNVTNMSEVSSVYEKNTLAWLLHVADEAATYVDHC